MCCNGPGKPSATKRPSNGYMAPPQAPHSRPAAASFSRLAWTSGSAQRIIQGGPPTISTMSSGEASREKPAQAARNAGQIVVEQKVGGIVDQQVVLVRLHPLFLVVLEAGFVRHAVPRPAEYLHVEDLVCASRDGGEDGCYEASRPGVRSCTPARPRAALPVVVHDVVRGQPLASRGVVARPGRTPARGRVRPQGAWPSSSEWPARGTPPRRQGSRTRGPALQRRAKRRSSFSSGDSCDHACLPQRPPRSSPIYATPTASLANATAAMASSP